MDELAALSENARKLAYDRFTCYSRIWSKADRCGSSRWKREFRFALPSAGVALYQQFGLAALVRSKRADTGRRGASAKMKAAIEGLALQKPPLPIATLYRQVRQLAQGIGEPPPSYWTVYRIVRDLPADLLTLAHEGTKAYSDAFELVRRCEADGPNAIGKPITRRLIFCWFVRMAKAPSRGSRS